MERPQGQPPQPFQQQLPTYDLPGVIRYLQQEWTTNERERINWENERAELKSLIGKLTSEVRSLKEINKKLKDQLNNKPNQENSTNNSKVKDSKDYDLKLLEIDLNPLSDAKRFLKDKMSEIDYILRSSSKSANDVIQFTKQKTLSIPTLESFSDKELTEKLQRHSINEDQTSINVDTIQPLTSTAQETHDLDDQSDVETIFGTDSLGASVSRNDSQSLSSKAYDPSSLIFTINNHLTEITHLSINGNNLLSFSKDGLIKHWNLLRFEHEHDKTEPEKIYFGFSKVKFLKWIDNKWFLAVTKENVINSYKIDDHQIQRSTKCFTNITSIDVNSKGLVVIDDKSLRYFKIECKNEVISYTEKVTQTLSNYKNYDFVKFASSSDESFVAYKKSDGSLEEISIEGNSVSLPLSYPGFTKLNLFNSEYGFISSDKVVVYNRENRAEIFSRAQKSISDLEITSKGFIISYSNGDIEIISRTTGKVVKKINHYNPSLGELNFDDLSPAEKEVFNGSKNIAVLYRSDKIVTAGEDTTIRGFKFDYDQ
ncbi:hypothetical protein WICMUC_001159 [Wickerhamomyces mucosus]|uniref:Striatin N-terminal domain-containing protein n=1 Tax=Wickerhamomyces mucosus TaxID=1378264 RepID=A0A9P8PVL9_9ASCO|nr:hypothetical protein WICMUC_001159 [Wickerhamomyces mucosus]